MLWFMGWQRVRQPCPPPGGLPDPGVKPRSLTSPASASGFFTTSATWEAQDRATDLLNVGIRAGQTPRPPDVSREAGFSAFPMDSLCCPSGFRPRFWAFSSSSSSAPSPAVTRGLCASPQAPPSTEGRPFLPALQCSPGPLFQELVMDREAWRAAIHHSSSLAWRIPWTI